MSAAGSNKLEPSTQYSLLSAFAQRGRNRKRRAARRGIAALFVLLLLSITLALSYAAMRSQGVAIQIHMNARRRPTAQQDAITGITMAMKKMTTSAWAGVGTTYSGTIGPYDSYQVAYVTGDPSLTAASTEWSDYPYRVTLNATGYSADPDNPQNTATYKIRAVVHLIPRALATEPSNWTSMLAYTFYQTSWGQATFDVPSQVQGPVYTQGELGMSQDIWSNSTIQVRYYSDLNPLRLAQGVDYRPFTGAVSYTSLLQLSNTLTLLTDLGLSILNLNWPSFTTWDPAAAITTYQIYPGGAKYNVQDIAGSQQGAAWQPNMTTNPLGIYYASGPVSLGGSTTFQGTLVALGDLTVSGSGVQFNPVSMPALYNTTAPVQLPVAVGSGQLSVLAGATLSVSGQMSLESGFTVETGPQAAAALTFSGQLIAGSIDLQPRTEWMAQTATWWTNTYNAFIAQVNKTGGIKYFPSYLQKYTTLNPTPQVIVKASPSAIRYHWQTWTNTQNQDNPIFVPASGDPGLRWDLLEWIDNPSN